MTPDASPLRGGVVVVTGGAGAGAGLGQGLVRGFAAHDMRVAILDVDVTAADALRDELRAAGIEAIARAVDVLDHEALTAAAALVGETFGACNVLCAHVGGGGQGRFEALSLDAWRHTYDVIVLGTVATVLAFLPLMRETGGLRRIVLTASAAALAPGRFQGPYRSAKAAVASIGETLDLELGPEGIGTTIAFPSGMLHSGLLDALQTGDASAAMLERPLEAQAVLEAVAEEMAPDPTDVRTGVDAAAPVVDAVLAGRRYVVTHGVSVERNYRRRQELIEAAFAELAARGHTPAPRASHADGQRVGQR